MSSDTGWDVEKYREEHESEEQWELRRAFLERWKNDHTEERLLCLAQVFTNMEFLGCRYPVEVMKEVSRMAEEVAKSYRQNKKSKLQRTFVSASDAAEDRARGVKRKGGVVEGPSEPKNVMFVPQGHKTVDDDDDHRIVVSDDEVEIIEDKGDEITEKAKAKSYEMSFSKEEDNNFLKDMQNMRCLDVNRFKVSMFFTIFGKMVLIMRPWTSKMQNIQAMCETCALHKSDKFENGCYSLFISDCLVARGNGATKVEAKQIVESLAWDRLKEECISIVVKELFISEGKITSDDVAGNKMAADEFGTPVENNVAMKMMKLMGWKGGGLGADQQGIAEPIKPHLQMVKRAGLGSITSDIRQLRKAVKQLMMRYKESDSLDVDLVFASDFSKEERVELHQVARSCALMSKSYGKDNDRFLVVKKKLDPFSLVRAIVEKGGSTPKYQVFIPEALKHR